jgi:glycerophosphoryl diester phosphodiesterase
MWPYPKLLAHRGGGILAPENTLAALRAGAQAGYRAVEFDVMLAADAVPVLMHDEHFGRTVAGTGRVAATPSAVLAKMDAGSWFGPAFAGEPVALYRDAVDYCRENGLWMNVEIKPAQGEPRKTGEVVAALTRQWLGADGSGSVLFSSFSVAALQAAQAFAPDIPRGLLVGVLPDDWQALMASLQVNSLHIADAGLSKEIVQQVRAAGYPVFCYTVNSRLRARQLFTWGVDAVCTDRIDRIAADFA